MLVTISISQKFVKWISELGLAVRTVMFFGSTSLLIFLSSDDKYFFTLYTIKDHKRKKRVFQLWMILSILIS